MEAIKNLKLVEAARKEAQDLVARDPSLSSLPAHLKEKAEGIHFE
jgi:hypothetical protein